MTSNLPLISTIIPVYNCEKYLSSAIDSVLGQTYPNIEIIVVNDGSTDRSSEVAHKYGNRIKYIYQENSGIGAARNKGINNARGEFLSFLDADDLWVNEKISIQYDILMSDESPDVVYGHVKQFLSPEIEHEIKHKYRCPEQSMPGRLASTMLISKEKFLSVGLFTQTKSVGVDLDWYLRATESDLKINMLEDILLKRRIHTSNIGILQKNKRSDYVKHLKESLDRRRRNKFIQ